MRNSVAIFDINANQGKAVRTSIRTANPGEVKVYQQDYAMNIPAGVATMALLAQQLSSIIKVAEKSPALKGRYTFLLPEPVAIRMFHMQSLFKKGVKAEQVKEDMHFDWMDREEYVLENGENMWTQVIDMLVDLVYPMLDKSSGFSLNFMNARTLYRWKLEGVTDDINGQTIHFEGGETNIGVYCTENSFLAGDLKVSASVVRDRNGRETWNYYVPRPIQYQNLETSERGHMSTSELEAADPKKFAPVSEQGVWIINAIKLRKVTASKLPRIQVADTMDTELVAGDIDF